MDSNEVAAVTRSAPEKASDKESDANTSESKLQVAENINREPPFTISAEVLRKLVDELTEKKPKSKFTTISNNQLIVGVVCLLVGAITTGVYTSWQKALDYHQQELNRQHSFSDELRKISIQKFGEVWERFDENELAIDNLLSESEEPLNTSADSNVKKFEEIRRLIHEDKVILSKSRFWIGEELYNKAANYLDLSVKYALNKLLGTPVDNLSELIRRREEAKQDILQIRKFFLEEESRQRVSVK